MVMILLCGQNARQPQGFTVLRVLNPEGKINRKNGKNDGNKMILSLNPQRSFRWSSQKFERRKIRKILGAFSRHPDKTGTKSFRNVIRVAEDRQSRCARSKALFLNLPNQTVTELYRHGGMGTPGS